MLRHRLAEGVGGLRGSIEAAIPTAVFVVVWTLTHKLNPALIAAGCCAGLALLLRIVQRKTPKYVLSSLLGLGLAAWFARKSGRAEDAFLPGIIYSTVMLSVNLLSVFIRWPLVGFVLAAANPENPFAWRGHPGILRLSQKLTLVLAGMFGIRALVMFPLYWAHQVQALGVAKIVLGWPLYALAMATCGAVLLKGKTPLWPSKEPGPSKDPR